MEVTTFGWVCNTAIAIDPMPQNNGCSGRWVILSKVSLWVMSLMSEFDSCARFASPSTAVSSPPSVNAMLLMFKSGLRAF